MDKWHYFNLGFNVALCVVALYCLLFGEVILWPMKKALHKHLLIYPLVILFVIATLFTTLYQMWK